MKIQSIIQSKTCIVAVAILSLLLLTECKKAEEQVVLSGYTERDDRGDLVPGGMVDADDWKSDEHFPNRIEQYMNHAPVQGGNEVCAGSTVQVSAYPNAVSTDWVTLKFSTNCSSRFRYDYTLFDKNLRSCMGAGAYDCYSGITSSIYMQNYPRGLYRVYYRLYDEQSGRLFYQGHGDIQKN